MRTRLLCVTITNYPASVYLINSNQKWKGSQYESTVRSEHGTTCTNNATRSRISHTRERHRVVSVHILVANGPVCLPPSSTRFEVDHSRRATTTPQFRLICALLLPINLIWLVSPRSAYSYAQSFAPSDFVYLSLYPDWTFVSLLLYLMFAFLVY